MIEISAPMYSRIAEMLRDRIGTAEWFNGSIEFETEEFHSRLTLSAIVYRRAELLPEGRRCPVFDVVPVWWEFSTVGAGGEEVNDFCFSELRPLLLDSE
jgi:hypothetical protein